MNNFSNRLITAMSKRNMKQSDLVKLTGINKGALSSYINGRYEPKQNNVYLLANCLNVNEAWLMGYDVPMEKNTSNYTFGIKTNEILKKISSNLDLPENLIKDIFINLRIDGHLELNYENVYLEIKKFLIENYNKNWDRDSERFNYQLIGFNYLLQSINWHYEIKEDSDNMHAYYELTNGDLKISLSNEEFSKFEEYIITTLKTKLQEMIIKSSNVFDNK